MTTRDRLQEVLGHVLKFTSESPPPPNEASVSDWVVKRVLRALGYEDAEILPEDTTAMPQRPDLTVLHGAARTWFVEVKSWKTSLLDKHADQAINYAHTQGKRWVLLTNGQEWRIYDDRLPGVSSDRLVAHASLTDPEEWISVLLALEKIVVESDRVGAALASRVLNDKLRKVLLDPKGPILRQITKKLKDEVSHDLEIGDVRRSLIELFGNGLDADPNGITLQDPSPNPQQNSHSDLEPNRDVNSDVNDTHVLRLGSFRGGKTVHVDATYCNGKVTLRRGTQICREPSKTYMRQYTRQFRGLVAASTRDEGDHKVLIEDIVFGTPSAAATFIYGQSANGWTSWKLSNGQLLSSIRPRKLAE
ncbi:MAG: hypothetical protein C4320_06110 [Armatimonadota bacterium]